MNITWASYTFVSPHIQLPLIKQ